MHNYSREQYNALLKLMKEKYDFTPENMYEHKGFKESIARWTNHPDSQGGKVWRII